MNRTLVLLISLVSIGLLAGFPAIQGAETKAVPVDISILPGSSKFDFIAYGDIRFTDPSNTRVSNSEVRRALVGRIADIKPPFLILTGDLVYRGSDSRDWQAWESETTAWRVAGIKVFPVPGNHELYEDPKAVHYFAHFPELKQRRWYTIRAGNTLFFMMDSDSDAVGGEEWNWLEQQLLHVPEDVDFLFFTFHHPPYTRSSDHLFGGGHAARSAEEKLAAMLERRQASMRPRMIVISGHVHNYERYEHGGVTYIVSGGGGATPYLIPRSPQDDYKEPGPTYHFVHFFVDGHQLRAEMVKEEILNGKTNWTVKDTFQMEAR
jgi:Icc-related predicted phosphoesterase